MFVGWDWAAPAPSWLFQILDFPLEKWLLFVPSLNEPLMLEMSNSSIPDLSHGKKLPGMRQIRREGGKQPHPQSRDRLGFGISTKSQNSYRAQP